MVKFRNQQFAIVDWASVHAALLVAGGNLRAHSGNTAIVAGIIGVGAMLMVLGSSLVSAVDRALQGSITNSVAGHLQVYSAASKEDIDLIGGMSGTTNLTPLDDFERMRRIVMEVPNVAAVVPMGINVAVVGGGNAIDRSLSQLRSAVAALQVDRADPGLTRSYHASKALLRQILGVLRRDIVKSGQVSLQTTAEKLADIDRATSDAFWSDFDDDPYERLEFLENRVAQLEADGEMKALRYIGTDPTMFQRTFERMKIVDGTLIPPGRRGFLFSKYTYESQFKLKVARGLDQLKTGIEDRGLTITRSPELQQLVRENQTAVRELVLQLDPLNAEDFCARLQRFLRSEEGDVSKLLAAFFATTDHNFQQRYQFFYSELAPKLDLYRFRIGDTVTLQTIDRTGYVRSANLTVFGTYHFRGLENSPQAGVLNMMDLVSFRELGGLLTSDRKLELDAMRRASGVRDVDRQHAESELFATKLMDHEAGAAAAPSTLSDLLGTRAKLHEAAGASYPATRLEEGPVYNAAVFLQDEDGLAETAHAIEQASMAAGLPLKTASWQVASGMLGQFATLMRAVLYTAVFITFIVALVVISNALVMSTLHRVREIGTLRALGAQRRFVLAVLSLESILLAGAAGLLGSALGALVLALLHETGIPATSDALTFAFAGSRLFPRLSGAELVLASVTALVVGFVSGIYPAWLANRVSPREAMQAEN